MGCRDYRGETCITPRHACIIGKDGVLEGWWNDENDQGVVFRQSAVQDIRIRIILGCDVKACTSVYCCPIPSWNYILGDDQSDHS
jgi:hypothetical protein